MKNARGKVIVLLILLCVTGSVYAQSIFPFENQEFYFVAYYDDLISPPFIFSFYDNTFYMDIPELDTDKIEEMKYIKGSIKEKYQITEKNGFIYLCTDTKKFLVLYNTSRICILIDCSNNDAFFGLNKNSKNIYIGKTVRSIYIGITGGTSFYQQTSSFLTELVGDKRKEYNGRGGKYYYQLTNPWVEGKEHDGIGEWIQKHISFNTDEVVFFNGYIDPNRPDLYYANSRVKEVLVTAGSSNWIFKIEDTPNPQILKLDKLASGNIRFTIKDVYKGMKYSDTSIAGIYFLIVRGQ